MTTADTSHIRVGTDTDTAMLDRLAAYRALRPLEAPVLIAERNGAPVAALSLVDGRVIADDSSLTEQLIASLRIQAITIWTCESEAASSDRMAIVLGEP